jgi:hypothetical protein
MAINNMSGQLKEKTTHIFHGITQSQFFSLVQISMDLTI